MVMGKSVRIYWPDKFFNYTEHLYKGDIGPDSKLKVLGDLIFENEFVCNYLVVSIVGMEKTHINSPQTYFEIGKINTNSRKFEYNYELKGNRSSSTLKIEIIGFESPKLPSMQFFSDKPIYDRLFSNSLSVLNKAQVKECSNFKKLVNFMEEDTVKKHPECNQKNYNFADVIHCLNIADHHLKIFNTANPGLVALQPNVSIKNSFLFKPIFQFIHMSVIPYFLIVIRILFCEILSKVFLNPLYWLRSYSISFLQLDLRIKQFSYFPIQYLDIGERKILTVKSDNNKLYASYMDYIRYYNTIWLVVNDYSFALTITSLLQVHKESIQVFLSKQLKKFLIDDVIALTNFMNENPYGIKLNDELSKFLKDLFLWIINFVDIFYFRFLVSKETLFFLIDALSFLTYCFGMTFAVAIIIDYMSILTLHFKLFYKISSKLYNCQLSLLLSLFYLFCGKKYNRLRNRVDSEHYSLEVLLIGVLMFMILIFLLPTIVGFYFIYTCLQYAVMLVEILLMTVLMCLNHFPLFIIMLKLKDGARIPCGINFKIRYERSIQEKIVCLEGVSMPWRQIFTNFLSILVQFQNEIFSLNVMKRCLFGNNIIIDKYSLYKPLYSTVPRDFIPLKDLVYRIFHENPRQHN